MKESILLRLIDRYLGVLICFFLSLCRRRRERGSVKKILFIELFEMGASIMAYPSLKFARDRYPDAQLYVLTARSNQESWEILNILSPNGVIALDGSNFVNFIGSLFRQIIALRAMQIDIVIDFEKFTRLAAIISRLVSPARAAGFFRYEFEGLYRGNLLDVRCAFNQNAHIAKNFLALTKAALDDVHEYPNFKGEIKNSELVLPRYNSNPMIRSQLRAKVDALAPHSEAGQLIVTAPDVGANLSVRNYPLPHLRQVLVALLAADPTRTVVIVGTPEHEAICAKLHGMVNNARCINLCSHIGTISELTELISMAGLYIGNDNGPAHFASLTPTKIVALFSTDTPYMYGPLGNCVVLYTFLHCSPCISALNHKRTRCTNNICLQSLDPQRILTVAEDLLCGRDIPLRTINGTLHYL